MYGEGVSLIASLLGGDESLGHDMQTKLTRPLTILYVVFRKNWIDVEMSTVKLMESLSAAYASAKFKDVVEISSAIN